MRYLVTGANGFIGDNIVKTLTRENHEVLSISNKKKETFKDEKNLNKFFCSLQEIDSLEKEILNFKPKIVFHLAAQSSPNISLEKPFYTYETNALGTLKLLEILKKLNNRPKIVLASSSSVYSKSGGKKSISECFSTQPLTMYGQSKLSMEQIGNLYFRRNNMDIVIARPFFLIGGGKNNDVCSAYAKNIVEIERGLKKEIEVGNLQIVRDFLDIEDGVSAFSTISKKGLSGEVYNISSGKGYSLKEILSIFKNFSNSEFEEKIEKKWIRSIDDSYRVGDVSKLAKLGWKPNINIEKSIKNILDYWRSEKLFNNVD